MNILHFFDLLVPPICHSVVRALKKSSIPNKPPLVERAQYQSEKMVIIGNGPSLNVSITKHNDAIMQCERMAVNHFASTDLFDQLCPEIYVLVDPAWFLSENTICLSAKKSLMNIVQRTTWPMTIVMPDTAKESFAVKCFEENVNLHLLFYCTGWDVPKGMTQIEAWDKNLITPPGQTVLNTCVWLSLYWGYKETYLIGADTSFLADELIDQETNEVYTYDRHFYQNEEMYKDASLFDKSHRRIIPTKFHEELLSVATALKGYWDMREYAEWKGLKVYNASEYSWIDAFERKKLV